MARPRVFISSTYYDLKYVRSNLEIFVRSMGYEPILSEKGSIAYLPDSPLDESCYREAKYSDIFVLILGGRYGSEATNETKLDTHEFYDRYESITKQEYLSATNSGVPTYILVDKSVYAEYQTYKNNKSNTSIVYAHVDSINIFHLIDYIFSQSNNNPFTSFDKHSDIEDWLRDQWSGLFRELLSRMSNQQRLSSLETHMEELREINQTLRSYLEEVVSKVSPNTAPTLIENERNRLLNAKIKTMILSGHPTRFAHDALNMSWQDISDAIAESDTIDDFANKIINKVNFRNSHARDKLFKLITRETGSIRHLDRIRHEMGLPPIFPSIEPPLSTDEIIAIKEYFESLVEYSHPDSD